ncbi:MAG: hypothetical protein DI598_07535 [Pseudopedobacter saltans]|uniref:Uncharacterized protein n=1 Tax=Pseudopedobacter saltans TaxID=151895 RepID=A0A2W5H1M4_9SPHI|nr:MAG: hypothetical protein DI598_07535 [Pseudopedobacter saltans]
MQILTQNFDIRTDEKFSNIAEFLLTKVELDVNDKRYALTEIEFYWKSDRHQDASVYDRKHTGKLKPGQIFVHYAGVDISLDNEYGIGGILIRGIYSLAENKSYNGPMVCAMKLLSGILDVHGTFATLKLVERETPLVVEINNTSRIGIGKNGITSGYHEKLYRFLIRYPKNK